MTIEAVEEYINKRALTKASVDYSRRFEDKIQRFYLFKYLKEVHQMTFGGVGRLFKLDHSTVIHGVKQWENYKGYKDVQGITEMLRIMFPLSQNDKQPKCMNEPKALEQMELLIFKTKHYELRG